MSIIDLSDAFTSEPTEEEYNREVEKLSAFIKRHPNSKIYSRMLRRVFCPRCHSQMEIAYGVCICHQCNGWITDKIKISDRNGVRHSIYELYPELEMQNSEMLKSLDCLDSE